MYAWAIVRGGADPDGLYDSNCDPAKTRIAVESGDQAT
jgi:hypothetical protein